MGERALLGLEVHVRRAGHYTAWARARSATDQPAALSLRHNGQEPLNAALAGAQWHWVKLGIIKFPRRASRSIRTLRVAATGNLRLDQLVLAGDPNHTPSGVADSAKSLGRALPDVYFADEFMRSKREAGAWQVVSGKWTIRELTVRERFDPSRSANAFSYLGVGTPAKPALAITGYPHWRNYSIEAAVRPLGGGAFGFVILRQDADNYYLFRCNPPRGQLELIRCLDGITDRLATRAGVLRIDQWYHFRLEACDGQLAASIDGHVVLRASDHTFLAGQPGIWSADERGVYFDDALVRSYHTYTERFADPALPGWDVHGEWKAAGGGVAGQGTLVSRESHGEFEAETRIQPGFREAGLVFDWRDAANHACLVLAADPPRIELRERLDGKPTTLASAQLPATDNSSHRIRLNQHDGRVRVYINGSQVVGAFRPNAGSGRVGLSAVGGAARFGSFRLTRAQRPPPDRGHNRVFAGEDTMAAWASAASDWQLATSGARTIAWHEIEHWGDCATRYELSQPGELPGKLGLVVRGDGQKTESGYQLIAEPESNGPPKLTLVRGTQVVAKGKAPSSVQAIELRWLADCAVAYADDKMVLWHRDGSPPAGRRAAIWTQGWSPVFDQTSVHSTNLIDDYFESAPVDWRTESGAWEMQNRWTCLPQWSWLGGSSPEAAMLWNKRWFKGDITVHFFAAFQMKKRDSRIYRPADLNVTICGDGRNLSSGYTFIYGGWNNTATSLLRGERVAANTSKVTLRPPTLLDTTPSTNHLHRKWWHVAIERRGPKITCYVDDQLALEYTDPEPLEGGSVCLWTHDNAIMIARVWIAYESSRDRENPVSTPGESPPHPGPLPHVATSHKAVFHDFESGLGKWTGSPGSSSVRLEARGGGSALAVTNPRAGGRFELKLPFESFDAMGYARLSFDYRIPTAAKVNLHAKMNGRTHAIILTNPEAQIAGIPVLGRANVVADDAWHSASIDLRALLLRCYPDATSLPVQELSISTLDKRNYLTAGFGGNYAGLTYRLDNVGLWSPGPPNAKFSWNPELTVSYALDRQPTTEPDVAKTEKSGSCEPKGLADGKWYFHIRCQQPDGTWSPVARYPIVVDGGPPRVVATSPPQGAKSPTHLVILDFADESGVDPKSLKVSFLGKEHPVQVVPSDPAASCTPGPVSFEPVAKKLAVDLSMLPAAFNDGQKLKLAVTAKDFLSQAMPRYELAWRYDRGADKEPPRVLRLEGSHPNLCCDDFETGFGEWQASPGLPSEKVRSTRQRLPQYAIIERDNSTAATGRYSLRIHNPHAGGAFAVTIRSTPFDAGRYPLVSFDYKIPPNLRADLVLTLGGTLYTIRFTDPNGTNCVGAIPGVKADNQWHHTEFNLHEILTSAVPKAATYVVTLLQFADTGFHGNADGVEYHVDNFCIAPAASTHTSPLEWKLSAADPSGVAQYQYSLTNLPGVTRWASTTSPTWQFRNLGAGIFHFLVRVCDRAGNWSEPLHRQILIDDQPPLIQDVAPKNGGRSAESRIRVRLADSPSGINRDKTTLTVAGVAYRTTDPGVTYDARSATLTWNGPFLAKPVVFRSAQQVAVALNTQDNVGNAATHKWSWKMDYSLDKTPPPALYVTRVPTKTLTRSTFEKDEGGWRPYSSYATVARVASTAATGRYALRITATRSRRYFGAYAYRSAFDAAKHPIVSFDYRIPPGLPMNLHVYVGSWRTIKLTSPSAYYTLVGSAPLSADDKWRHAEIDLRRFLKPTSSKSPAIPVRYILFCDFATRSSRPGAGFYIDNFAIATPESGQNLRFEWNAVADPTGIAGYAYAFDKKPNTTPTQLRGPSPAASFQNVAPGTWFLHLRARDGAGNWGPTTHFKTAVSAPAKR